VTVSWVADAAVTMPCVAPKNTILPVVKELKLEPLIVMELPAGANKGLIAVTTGGGGELKTKPERRPVPRLVVTDTSPVDPPPTTAEMLVDEFTIKDRTGVPPSVTDVAPSKWSPVIVTVAPVPAVEGLMELMTGARCVNPEILPVPYAFTIVISPVAPSPTVASTVLSSTTVNERAGTPPKLTAVAEVNEYPLMVSTVPLLPEVGLKDWITAGPRKRKPLLEPTPAWLVTLTVPDVPADNVAVMDPGLLTVKEAAGVPPKLTAVAPAKPAPVMVTALPCAAAAGEKEAI